jgi:hypothetical protein
VQGAKAFATGEEERKGKSHAKGADAIGTEHRARPVTGTPTATATSIAWDMGDGTTVTCHTPGSPYPGGDIPFPDCGHTYRRVSASAPGGAYTVTATTTWTIRWAATNGQDGTFTATRANTVGDIRVGELDRQVEGLAEVAGAHRPARVGQGGEDLLIGGVVWFGGG